MTPRQSTRQSRAQVVDAVARGHAPLMFDGFHWQLLELESVDKGWLSNLKINIAGRMWDRDVKDMDEFFGMFSKDVLHSYALFALLNDRLTLFDWNFNKYIYIYPFQPCRCVSSSSGANLAQWTDRMHLSTTATVKTRKKMELPVVLSPKEQLTKTAVHTKKTVEWHQLLMRNDYPKHI